MLQKKTDNTNLRAKLDLRRYFLQKYHGESLTVLDCCQGSGLIWDQLKKEFKVNNYTSFDVKPKAGRLKIDSVRFLSAGNIDFNCIDIDTYGSPWRHYFELIKNIKKDCTVFLTCGTGGPNRVKLTGQQISALGINLTSIQKLSGTITHKLFDMAINYSLTSAYDYDIIISDGMEAETTGNAKYIGLRLEVNQCH